MEFNNQWLTELYALCRERGDPQFATYVMEACRNRRAFLFFATDGWVVVEPRAAPVKHVFVLAAWCDGTDAIARYEPVLFEFASKIGCAVLRFEAARPGYNRLMPKRGWQQLADGKTWEKANGWRR